MNFRCLQWIPATALALIIALNSQVASADTTIRVTLQLPANHSIGENWLAFKKIVEAESNLSLIHI